MSSPPHPIARSRPSRQPVDRATNRKGGGDSRVKNQAERHRTGDPSDEVLPDAGEEIVHGLEVSSQDSRRWRVTSEPTKRPRR